MNNLELMIASDALRKCAEEANAMLEIQLADQWHPIKAAELNPMRLIRESSAAREFWLVKTANGYWQGTYDKQEQAEGAVKIQREKYARECYVIHVQEIK